MTFVDDDSILVADASIDRIQQFNVQTGNAVRSFGNKGSRDGELKRPASVCIDDEGRVAVVYLDNKRIHVFTKGR